MQDKTQAFRFEPSLPEGDRWLEVSIARVVFDSFLRDHGVYTATIKTESIAYVEIKNPISGFSKLDSTLQVCYNAEVVVPQVLIGVAMAALEEWLSIGYGNCIAYTEQEYRVSAYAYAQEVNFFETLRLQEERMEDWRE